MRKKRLSVIALSILSMLTSCGEKSIAGTYGFQMGKEKGTHFGIHLKLSDDKAKYDNIDERAKKCVFSLNVVINNNDDADSITGMLGVLALLFGQSFEDDTLSINGYYYADGTTEKKGEQILKIGLDVSYIKQTIQKIIDDYNRDFPDSPIDIEIPDFSPELVEQIIFTTYLKEVVTTYIPVSIVDLLYQLYWYGVDFNYTEQDGITMTDTPFGEHEPGSHPTAEQVEEMNSAYVTTHEELAKLIEKDLSSYRDYYTLGMGLIKQ